MLKSSGTAIQIEESKQSETIHSIQYLPCKVECVCNSEEARPGNHPAKVSTYFEPTLRKAAKTAADGKVVGVMGERHSATFRGRPLSGVAVKVPEGFVGRVLTESRPRTTSDEGRRFVVKTNFDEFHYWKLETPPTADDKLIQALQYTALANSLHRAVTPERED